MSSGPVNDSTGSGTRRRCQRIVSQRSGNRTSASVTFGARGNTPGSAPLSAACSSTQCTWGSAASRLPTRLRTKRPIPARWFSAAVYSMPTRTARSVVQSGRLVPRLARGQRRALVEHRDGAVQLRVQAADRRAQLLSLAGREVREPGGQVEEVARLHQGAAGIMQRANILLA